MRDNHAPGHVRRAVFPPPPRALLSQPAEVSMLNALVNGYLLDRGYKLTAITLSEEVTGQVRGQWRGGPGGAIRFHPGGGCRLVRWKRATVSVPVSLSVSVSAPPCSRHAMCKRPLAQDLCDLVAAGLGNATGADLVSLLRNRIAPVCGRHPCCAALCCGRCQAVVCRRVGDT